LDGFSLDAVFADDLLDCCVNGSMTCVGCSSSWRKVEFGLVVLAALDDGIRRG